MGLCRPDAVDPFLTFGRRASRVPRPDASAPLAALVDRPASDTLAYERRFLPLAVLEPGGQSRPADRRGCTPLHRADHVLGPRSRKLARNSRDVCGIAVALVR